MTTRRTTTPTAVAAVKPRRSLAEIAAWTVGGMLLLSMCANKAEDMSASGTAKATAVVGTGAGAAGLGAGAGAFAAYCLKFPKACQNMGKGRTKEEPIITPATQPPAIRPPTWATPRPTVPPAPSIPTIPTVGNPKSTIPTPTTICRPTVMPQLGGTLGAQQVCS